MLLIVILTIRITMEVGCLQCGYGKFMKRRRKYISPRYRIYRLTRFVHFVYSHSLGAYRKKPRTFLRAHIFYTFQLPLRAFPSYHSNVRVIFIHLCASRVLFIHLPTFIFFHIYLPSRRTLYLLRILLDRFDIFKGHNARKETVRLFNILKYRK